MSSDGWLVIGAMALVAMAGVMGLLLGDPRLRTRWAAVIFAAPVAGLATGAMLGTMTTAAVLRDALLLVPALGLLVLWSRQRRLAETATRQ